MVPRTVKDILNARLHDQVLGLGDQGVLDYTRSRANMQPILDRLALDGWQTKGWIDRLDGTQPVSWELARHTRLRRVMVLRKTRTLEHQALVLSLPIKQGGVTANDNGTYEGGLQQVLNSSLNSRIDVLRNNVPIIIDEQPSIVAILSLNAKTRGPRPSNWIRDI